MNGNSETGAILSLTGRVKTSSNRTHHHRENGDFMKLLLLYAICIAAMTQVRVPQRWLLVGWVGVVLLAATLAF